MNLASSTSHPSNYAPSLVTQAQLQRPLLLYHHHYTPRITHTHLEIPLPFFFPFVLFQPFFSPLQLWMNRLCRLTTTRLTVLTPTRSIQFAHSFVRSYACRPTMEALKLHNSLAPGQPVPFEPIEKGKVSWYACGPTVYDKSHLGHARNYVSTDIIRRILLHYFKADLNFVMNITDVDDKVRNTERECTGGVPGAAEG